MSFRRLLFTIGLVLITGTSFIFPVGTFAAEDTCECYCNVEGTGATKVPAENSPVTVDRCQELCRDGGLSVATCAFEPGQRPEHNIMCFKPDECTAQKGVQTASGLGTPPQPGECKAGMYYCYPDPSTRKEATLQVVIGGLTATGDLGEYISVAYKWMLGVGTTIAIVFVMVAGLRWTLGGVNAEQIGKAKKTIQNAVIGLVLLLSTYVIIFTVNPYLVRLQVPAFPMIKPLSLVGKGSCGYLTGFWGTQPYKVVNGAPYDSPHIEGGNPGKPYTLKNATGTDCGSVADVTKDPAGATVADMTCTYDYCPKVGNEITRCFGVGDAAECATCVQVKTPSSANCSVFSTKQLVAGDPGKVSEETRCFYAKGLSLIKPEACAQLHYECSNIKSCSDYDKVQVKFGTSSLDLKDLDNNDLLEESDTDLASLCNEDPCGVAPDEEICQAKYGDFTIIFYAGAELKCKSSSEWSGSRAGDAQLNPDQYICEDC